MVAGLWGPDLKPDQHAADRASERVPLVALDARPAAARRSSRRCRSVGAAARRALARTARALDCCRLRHAGRRLGRRHLQVALLSLGLSLAYSCRVNLSVCIVEMTNMNSTSGFPAYDWNQSQTGLILSAFFWGYVVTQVPAGMLAQRYGPKQFLMVGVVGCSLLTILTPLVAAYGGWRLMCALRVCEGLFQGMIYPSSHTMLGRWIPPLERGRASAFVYSGTSLGTVSTMAGVGLLASSSWGWPSGFHLPGALGLVWGVAWLWLAADSPAACPAISEHEREYIESALGASSSGDKILRVPWRSIATSLPFFALLVTHLCQNFGHWILLTQMPNFMKNVLHFDVKHNGLNSALPYLCLLLSSFVVGYLAQVVNERKILSMTASRKVFNSMAHWGAGTALMVLAFTHVTSTQAVALLTVTVALESGTLAGFLVNHVDLSPNFGGMMMGVTNSIANTMGIIAPIFVSQIVGDANTSTQEELENGWSIVFMIAACVYFSGNLLFVLAGSAQVQPWNSPSPAESKKHQVSSAGAIS
ncbi:putative inorganic phosphate cotransporter isoform X3 [Frankliniella occidentalis]|uniref:Putative inorganic phosphate cotransporter n=1 Tax=Frankliniella occidentalis TaxID=133901 RepID=A0A6J1S4C2_FRAOC|nr:putative inorganic phosphate cotransporter isoform X3 [Frankliniella occidentalis]